MYFSEHSFAVQEFNGRHAVPAQFSQISAPAQLRHRGRPLVTHRRSHHRWAARPQRVFAFPQDVVSKASKASPEMSNYSESQPAGGCAWEWCSMEGHLSPHRASLSLWYMIWYNTRSSADADNRRDAFSGQARSTNMVPFLGPLRLFAKHVTATTRHKSVGYRLVIWRRNRFLGTGSKICHPVPQTGTRNRFMSS